MSYWLAASFVVELAQYFFVQTGFQTWSLSVSRFEHEIETAVGIVYACIGDPTEEDILQWLDVMFLSRSCILTLMLVLTSVHVLACHHVYKQIKPFY